MSKSNEVRAGEFAASVGDTLASRNGTHGDPVENHDHIADMWNAYLGDVLKRPLTGDEAADLMILLKLSRKHVGGMDKDHYLDIVGYGSIASLYVPAADAERMETPEQQRARIQSELIATGEFIEVDQSTGSILVDGKYLPELIEDAIAEENN